MARFEIDAKAIADLDIDLKSISDAIVGLEGRAVLESAGVALSARFRETIQHKGLVDTAQLRDSIRPTKVRKDKRSKYIDIYPQDDRALEGGPRGGRKKAVRNYEVGYAHEYGVTRVPPKKSTPATHWMSNTIDDVGEEIPDIMQAGINKIIDNNLGGK